MFARSARQRLCGSLLLLLLVGPLAGLPLAQEEPPATRRAEAPPKPRPKSRGRLPMYFAQVVTSQQREQIYEIQDQFDQQIEELMLQVRALQQQRSEAVHAVLTPEQQKEVAAMVADARKRRQLLRGGGTAAEEAEDEHATEGAADDEEADQDDRETSEDR